MLNEIWIIEYVAIIMCLYIASKFNQFTIMVVQNQKHVYAKIKWEIKIPFLQDSVSIKRRKCIHGNKIIIISLSNVSNVEYSHWHKSRDASFCVFCWVSFATSHLVQRSHPSVSLSAPRCGWVASTTAVRNTNSSCALILKWWTLAATTVSNNASCVCKDHWIQCAQLLLGIQNCIQRSEGRKQEMLTLLYLRLQTERKWDELNFVQFMKHC